MGRLQGKRALITGAGSGIGKATSLLFAKEGATVIAADIKGQDEVAANGADAIIPYECDVANPEAVEAMMAFARKKMDGLDVLFNNAGIGRGGKRLHEIDLKTGTTSLTSIFAALFWF